MKRGNTSNVFRLHLRRFLPLYREEDFQKALSSFTETLQGRLGASSPRFSPQPMVIETVNWTWPEIVNTNFATADVDANVASQDETDWSIVTRGKRKGALLRPLPPACTGLKEPPGRPAPKQRKTVIFRPAKVHNIPHIKEKCMAAHLTQVTSRPSSQQTYNVRNQAAIMVL